MGLDAAQPGGADAVTLDADPLPSAVDAPGTLVSAESLASAPNAKPPATAVGTEDDLTARARDESIDAWASWQDDIAKAISKADSAPEAHALLSQWAAQAKSDSGVVESIYQAALMANMAGQLQVRLVEVPEAASSRAASRPLLRVALAADGSFSATPFLALPFQEAIDDFLARGIVTPEQFRQMDAAARTRAFTAAGFATDTLREQAYEAVLAALRDGTTLREFAAQLRSGEASLGVTPADPAYVETVFRTNVATAYGAGRIQQMQAPAVLQARPFVEYRAIIDPRTTNVCRYLNGLIFDRRTDPGWDRFAPPNHYNCRSTIAVLSTRNVDQSRVTSSADIDQRGQPLAPFDGPPRLSLG